MFKTGLPFSEWALLLVSNRMSFDKSCEDFSA